MTYKYITIIIIITIIISCCSLAIDWPHWRIGGRHDILEGEQTDDGDDDGDVDGDIDDDIMFVDLYLPMSP